VTQSTGNIRTARRWTDERRLFSAAQPSRHYRSRTLPTHGQTIIW